MKTLLLASLLLVGACADAHLGDVYGRRTRAALDAERDARTEGTTLDAQDAKLVSQRHHNTPTQGAAPATSAILVPTSGGYGGSSGGSSMSGVAPAGPPAGGIRLDAVR